LEKKMSISDDDVIFVSETFATTSGASSSTAGKRASVVQMSLPKRKSIVVEDSAEETEDEIPPKELKKKSKQSSKRRDVVANPFLDDSMLEGDENPRKKGRKPKKQVGLTETSAPKPRKVVAATRPNEQDDAAAAPAVTISIPRTGSRVSGESLSTTSAYAMRILPQNQIVNSSKSFNPFLA
jgi:hypothetical protein